jgi:hypothetical protein
VDPTAQILEASSLARTLVHVYKALLGEASPHLEINSSIKLSLLIPHPTAVCDKKRHLSFATEVEEPMHEGASQQDAVTNVPPHLRLRPYQTLLLLKDSQETLQDLPPGNSPLLRELIQKASPLQRYVLCFS